MSSLLYESVMHVVPLLFLELVEGVADFTPFGALGSA